MKVFIISMIATLPIVIFDVFSSLIYTEFANRVLKKDRSWAGWLALWVGLLLFQTGLYTWVPGRFGLEITCMDGLITFQDGALIGNLGLIMLIHAAGIGLAILGYLWKTIRKKVKYNGKFLLLELAMTVLLLFLGIQIGLHSKT